MCKFKIGDKVEVVVKATNGKLYAGHVGKITDVCLRSGSVQLDNNPMGWVLGGSGGKLKLLTNYPNPPHKHAELIKAWADGAEIEMKGTGGWLTNRSPLWWADYQYRIKPTKTTAELEKESILKDIVELQKRLDKLEVV